MGKLVVLFCHRILKKFSVQNTCEVVNKFFHDSIIAAFVGCRFNFKFNVCLTKTIPRGLLTFKTLTNSITHTQYNNLIATNFTITEAEHFKTVLNILEAKLLLKDSPSDATVFTVHKEQSRLHDNSYLYGSWLSDTASQEMYLVSLNDKHCCNSIPTQCSLVDSVYWRWEQTSAEDEEIISDVVDHLELSKNEFLTSDDNCDDRTVTLELHSVDSENLDDVYDESFIKDFFSTQNVEGLHSMAATNLTDNQATKTPSATYSPELFSVRKYRKLEVDQHAMSTPPPFSVAKTSTSSRVLFEDESLNSPCLFGEVDCGRTPIGKMSVTADFTSPALC